MSDPFDDLIDRWRSAVGANPAVHDADLDELESHLRDQADELRGVGLTDEEAFLVAVRRLGAVDALSGEFARVHTERLWKQLFPDRPGSPEGLRRAVAFAVVAAVLVLLPRLFMPAGDYFEFVVRNAPLVALPLLAAWLLTARGALRGVGPWLAGGFAVLGGIVNGYPFALWSDTEVITILHAPIAGWALVGAAHMAGEWRSHGRRMDVVRFTGEAFVYLVLIALGGGVLTGITIGLFATLGIDIAEVASSLMPGAAAGALVVAAWLVERKQQVIENMAPVLSAVFTPILGLVLGIAAVAGAVSGFGIEADREVLILFDVLLVLVTGLLLYRVSAREPSQPRGILDVAHLATIGFALLLDLVGLVAMVGRIAEFGASPNKVVALGLNLLLLVTLGRSGWLLLGFVRGRLPCANLERWQTTTLPLYAGWALLVVAVIPPIFGFD